MQYRAIYGLENEIKMNYPPFADYRRKVFIPNAHALRDAEANAKLMSKRFSLGVFQAGC